MEEKREGVRLNRYLAETGLCSRREADRMIESGQVRVDGRVGVLGDRVAPGTRVLVNGRDVSPVEKKVYIALNKPVGVVCTADPREPMNVIDYIGHSERIFPIGRLDKDSQGLLLLTNDGEIVNRILRAAGGHEKEYVVSVDKPITPQFCEAMRRGVPILDTVTLPCRLKQEGPCRFRLVLVQGLNRQIRRMCEALGYNVQKLRRVRINNICIGTLQPGQWRELTEAELSGLLASIKDSSNLPAAMQNLEE